MKKILVAYFSASGETAKLAKTIAGDVGGDLFEIVPTVPYTAADLDWMDKGSRSTVEMNDDNSRPAIAGKVADMAQYDTVFVEFPIVKDTTPNMMNPRLYTTSYNKPQGQQFDDTAVLSFIKLQYT